MPPPPPPSSPPLSAQAQLLLHAYPPAQPLLTPCVLVPLQAPGTVQAPLAVPQPGGLAVGQTAPEAVCHRDSFTSVEPRPLVKETTRYIREHRPFQKEFVTEVSAEMIGESLLLLSPHPYSSHQLSQSKSAAIAAFMAAALWNDRALKVSAMQQCVKVLVCSTAAHLAEHRHCDVQ